MKTTPTTGGEAPGAAAELPVVAHRYGTALLWADDAPVGEPDCEALTPHAPAQAQLDALREEVARLTKERDEWKAGFSRYRQAARKAEDQYDFLQASISQPSDVDAVMALACTFAEKYAKAHFATQCGIENTRAGHETESAREALRAKLAARKEEL